MFSQKTAKDSNLFRHCVHKSGLPAPIRNQENNVTKACIVTYLKRLNLEQHRQIKTVSKSMHSDGIQNDLEMQRTFGKQCN